MKKLMFILPVIVLISCGKTSMDNKSSATSSYKCSQVTSCSNTCYVPTAPTGASANGSAWSSYSSAVDAYNACMASSVEVVNGVVVKK